jgi:hypothetical protein
MSRFPFYRQYDATDCGVACLRMISKYYGKNIGRFIYFCIFARYYFFNFNK